MPLYGQGTAACGLQAALPGDSASPSPWSLEQESSSCPGEKIRRMAVQLSSHSLAPT